MWANQTVSPLLLADSEWSFSSMNSIKKRIINLSVSIALVAPLLLCVGCVALFFDLPTAIAEPCGVLDSFLGRPSGCIWILKSGSSNRIAFLPDGKTMALDTGDGVLTLIDAASGLPPELVPVSMIV